MAYPNPIKTAGALSEYSDIFEYFKGALLQQYDGFFDPEKGPIRNTGSSFVKFPQGTGSGGSAPSLPINRGQFYTFIDTWTSDVRNSDVAGGYFSEITSQKLYTFQSPVSGWPWAALNDWGKIKSVELALFGSVGNGLDLSAVSLFSSGTIVASIPSWTRSSISYLRYALARFDDYGVCHPESVQRPMPTSPVTNVGARTFNWTNASGFTNNSDYEYSINDGSWTTVTAKPISVPSGLVREGALLVRTRGFNYQDPSDTISNDQAYP